VLCFGLLLGWHRGKANLAVRNARQARNDGRFLSRGKCSEPDRIIQLGAPDRENPSVLSSGDVHVPTTWPAATHSPLLVATRFTALRHPAPATDGFHGGAGVAHAKPCAPVQKSTNSPASEQADKPKISGGHGTRLPFQTIFAGVCLRRQSICFRFLK
jgi:hypothetical protein